MKAVVDTNVIACLILGTDRFIDEARGFMAALDQAWAPALWEAELANAIWMAVRHKVLPLDEAAKRLILADGLGIHSVANRTLWQGALVRAHETNAAVYDTLFVELAVRKQVSLATFDSGMIKAFPSIAVRPGTLVPK